MLELIASAENRIESVVENLSRDYGEEDYNDDHGRGRVAAGEVGFERDSFDDVDR